MTIRMNMVTQTPEFHHYLSSNVIDDISTEIIQQRTLLNPYIHHTPSVNQQIQCDNKDEYGNMNSRILPIFD